MSCVFHISLTQIFFLIIFFPVVSFDYFFIDLSPVSLVSVSSVARMPLKIHWLLSFKYIFMFNILKKILGCSLIHFNLEFNRGTFLFLSFVYFSILYFLEHMYYSNFEVLVCYSNIWIISRFASLSLFHQSYSLSSLYG